VLESEYQPINGSRKDGVQVLSSIPRDDARHGGRRAAGNPSLVWVLSKTYGLQFLVSVVFKITSDLLAFGRVGLEHLISSPMMINPEGDTTVERVLNSMQFVADEILPAFS